MPRALVMAALLLAACEQDEETTWSQFNAADDELQIAVGVEDLLDPMVIELRSTTGEVIVGTAEVDPGGGPIGTEHEIVVIVDDSYEDIVDRVSVRTNSGDRGVDEYDLDPDSADEGFYKTTLVSVGVDGETRTDTFTVRLWDQDGDNDAETTTEETDTGD